MWRAEQIILNNYKWHQRKIQNKGKWILRKN